MNCVFALRTIGRIAGAASHIAGGKRRSTVLVNRAPPPSAVTEWVITDVSFPRRHSKTVRSGRCSSTVPVPSVTPPMVGVVWTW